MTGFLPRSLLGQTLAILLAGFLVSHVVGAWIYAGAREDAVRSVGAFAIAERVANLTRLVDETPADLRARIVAALNEPTFSVSLSHDAPDLSLAGMDAVARAIGALIADRLSRPDLRIAVAVSGPSGLPFMAPPRGPMAMGRGLMLHDMGAWRALEMAVELSDGEWLSFATAVPDTGPPVAWPFILSLALTGLIVVVVSAWAVRRVTAPLGVLASAAERVGLDIATEPLAEVGTAEMRQASRAFNQMQTRLRQLIENRTRMLAAISHDLRTPLTLLRLRAETIDNPDNRTKMLATIAEMDAMVGATLAFARDEATTEPRRRADLAALLASIVDDMADAGLPVTMEPSEPVVCECQPGGLKRALANLLDNAVKYGGRAHAHIRIASQTVEITIDDDGPGIPEEELARVLEPYYRSEASRNRETGGVGLGLAIALATVRAQGGRLSLSNRPEGGLRAIVALPI